MPKMLKSGDLPKAPPPIDFDSMSPAEVDAFLAQVSGDPSTWFHKGRCLKGMPWWLETPRQYFTAHEIMITYNIDRRRFIALHESGVIPGATYVPRTGRQRKDQPVVATHAFLARVIKDGVGWFLQVNPSPAPPPRPGRRPGPQPVRTRVLELPGRAFGEVLERSRCVPLDVAMVVQYDEHDRFVASIAFDRRGRIAGVSAEDPNQG